MTSLLTNKPEIVGAFALSGGTMITSHQDVSSVEAALTTRTEAAQMAEQNTTTRPCSMRGPRG